MDPPLVEPAPTMVWISSMHRMLEVLLEPALEALHQPGHAHPDRLQDLEAARVGAQREQQVLQGHVLVPPLPGLADRGLDRGAQLVGHLHGLDPPSKRSPPAPPFPPRSPSSSPSLSGSRLAISGKRAFSAAAATSATLVSATE
jgi:hypothetical protein